MKLSWVLLSFVGILLAACAAPGGTVPSETTATPAPAATQVPVDLSPAQRAAVAALATQLGLPADQITVVSTEAVTWKDGCLGVVLPGVMCRLGPVPGFRIVLQAGGKQYEYHTNQDGSAVLDATGRLNQPPTGTPAPEPTSTPAVDLTHVPVDIPPAQRAAIDAAVKALGLPADQVKLVSIEPVEWPDGCLGVRRIGVMCVKGPVPGFRIILAANGKQYEFHTNQDASVVAPSSGPAVEAPDAITGKVKDALAAALGLPASDIEVVSAQIVEWPDSCLGVATPGVACAQIVTPGYLAVVAANGQQYEYHTNGDGSVVVPATQALSWQRTGGLVGFADSLTVYRSGEIHADWRGAPGGGKDGRLADLSQNQQRQLQGWLARFGAVSLKQGDPPAPDQVTILFAFIGDGDAQPGAADQQAMLDWAQGVLAVLQR